MQSLRGKCEKKESKTDLINYPQTHMKHVSEVILSQFDHCSRPSFNSAFDSLITIRHEFLNIQKISDLMSIEKDRFVTQSQKFSVVETLEEIINIKNY